MKLVYKFIFGCLSKVSFILRLNSAMKLAITGLLGLVIMMFSTTSMANNPVKNGVCQGEFINPITGMCWSCIMPIGISGLFYKGGQEGTKDLKGWEQYICTCDLFIGVPISYYEPARMIDVTTKPYCMVSLGGISFAETGSFNGDTQGFAGEEYGDDGKEFYQAHYYVNPIMYVMGLILDGSKCFEESGFDVGYLTEVDPSWNNSDLANILSPDGFLYGNFPAVFACTGDCIASTASFGVAQLHWCVGCGGLMYPMTGQVNGNTSTLETAGVIQMRLLNKLHRQGINMSYYGNDGLCGGYRQVLMNKRQYKYSMVYPVGQTKSTISAINKALNASGGVVNDASSVKDGASFPDVLGKTNKQCCQPFGRTTQVWGVGRYYPVKGEDQSYQIYRKRDCCQKVFGF